MPSLTAKAFAELIHTPLYGQLRILREQKYPRQAPGVFKVQYYRPALRVIRRFFQQGNNPAILPGNAAAIPGVGNKPDRIDHNFRTLTAFMNGSQSSRLVTVLPTDTYAFDLANVTVKATPELIIEEGDPARTRFLIYDCREQRPEKEIIRTTVELFHHVINQNGQQTSLRAIEYVHLETDEAFSWNRPRQRTIQRAQTTAAAIQTLWGTI
ncbi:MAG: hypothetical protein ACOC7K_00145 [bacterium]